MCCGQRRRVNRDLSVPRPLTPHDRLVLQWFEHGGSLWVIREGGAERAELRHRHVDRPIAIEFYDSMIGDGLLKPKQVGSRETEYELTALGWERVREL